MGTANPHDTLFHFTFQHPRHAAGWLRSVLPPELVAAIDWTTLRAAPEKVHGHALRLQVTDVLFNAELRNSRHALFLLPEHKSWFDPELHGQLLGYCTHIAQNTRDAKAPPTLVVPILLCHDKTVWPAAPAPHPHLARLDPAAAEALAAVQPRLAFFVDDLLRAVDRDDGPPLGRDAVDAIGWYCLRVAEIPAWDLHLAFERILQRPEETIMSTAEKLIREGLERGRTEGRTEGRAELLLRQLTKRFGPLSPEAVTHINSATIAELDRWGERLLDAKTLAEVFAAG